MKKIKKDYKRTLVKDINIFLKKKKKKSNIMVVNITKISNKMKFCFFISNGIRNFLKSFLSTKQCEKKCQKLLIFCLCNFFPEI